MRTATGHACPLSGLKYGLFRADACGTRTRAPEARDGDADRRPMNPMRWPMCDGDAMEDSPISRVSELRTEPTAHMCP
eukprot:7024632-Prymnesium_polylepis.1